MEKEFATEEARGGGQKGEGGKIMGEFGEKFAALLYYFNFFITLCFTILCLMVHTEYEKLKLTHHL